MITPYLITPFDNSNLKKWYKPYLIGRAAFPTIENAYARRGVVRKREGYRLLATLPAGDKPVQGLKNWVNPASLGNRLIAFSLTKSYLFDDGTQTFINVTFRPDTTPFSFTSTANDYYWTCNFAGSMWETNGVGVSGQNDHINYWNITNNWSLFNPQVDATNFLNAALIILPYKGRLVTLNTVEGAALGGGTAFQNRARWSQLGTPYVANNPAAPVFAVPAPGFGVDANAWRSDIPGKGGFNDADTSERIVSAEIIQDTLIVFFQRSTWRLRYTGNEILPFIWERINTQYGAESTFSNIAFDKEALAFSRYGWIGSTTNDVVRIDLDIPDDSFAIEGGNTDITDLAKVQGIRDFFRNFAYWTYIPEGQTFATQIYAYNYLDRSWTIYTPTNPINVFGTYRQTAPDVTWASLNAVTDTWSNYNSPDDTWQNFGTGQNQDFPYILGGDLNGNVFIMFEFFSTPSTDNGVNFNFDIFSERINPYLEKGMKAKLLYVDIYCTTSLGGQITLNHFLDDKLNMPFTKTVNLFQRGTFDISSVVVGNPTTTINTTLPHELVTGELALISDIQGTVGPVLNGNSYVVTVITPTQFTIAVNTSGNTYTGFGYLYNATNIQGDANYIRVFLGGVGRMHQIELTLSDEQLADTVKGSTQFEWQGLVLWFREQGRIRQ